MEPGYFCPLTNARGFIPNRYQPDAILVSRLVGSIRPTDILWPSLRCTLCTLPARIIAAIINAI
jgi:hypothetical protein